MVFKISLNVMTHTSFQSHLHNSSFHLCISLSPHLLHSSNPSHENHLQHHPKSLKKKTPHYTSHISQTISFLCFISSLNLQTQMFSPFPSFLLSLTLLLLLPLSSTSLSTHEEHKSKDLESMNMNMDLLETETLFLIMETMSSDRKWRLDSPNPCKPGSSWPGIECKPGNDNHLHVSRLDFGTPPNPTCKKTATFPSQIFNLPYLQSVFFFNCFTHTKTTISIPPLTNHKTSPLQQLSLGSNQALVGAVPPQISSLKSLQILTLSQNRLHGKIPQEISSLSSLIHLELSYNFLIGSIPNQIGNLKNLVGLDLSYNSLTGPIPEAIGKMGLLQKLDLSSNFLTGGIPDSLENLSFLNFMALSGNKLRGKFPKGLAKLQNLQYFIMDDNPMFMQLPADFGRLVKLQELRLANSGNMLRGVVPFDAGFLKRLGRNLDLSGNQGLCLNGSLGLEAMQIGVGECGNNKTASVIHPLKRSGAPSELSNLANFLGFLGVWGLYQRFF
ncbi:uncharacterized protein LOC143861815 isoform X2 [Tasmannia lanceolata]|uniref:uncharacterized protein LOC143861815 isoform X2 n=1 Tax=Tasmannia lanceolata TaxID=3420 RepID=UPI0040645118